MSVDAAPDDAFGDLHVLDFTRFLPGGYVSWMLADLGADVVRIEHPREIAKKAFVEGIDGDDLAEQRRRRGAMSQNRNKRSLLINPGKPASREVLLEMVRRADVLVEDYRPGVMAKMGYGYAEMAEVNPRLVYCSVSLAGQTGPYAGRAGHDPVALSLSGAMSRLNGTPTPHMTALPVADVLAGAHATIGTMAALEARRRTGRGQLVDQAMSEACLPLIMQTMWRNPQFEEIARPDGSWTPKGGVWLCQDGEFICTTDLETRYWQKFCEVMGHPEYAALKHDQARFKEMHVELSRIFLTKTRDEWFAIFAAADTQAMPVYGIDEAMADPHNVARGNLLHIPLPDGRTVRQIATPFKLSATPARVRFVSGLPGDDNAAILSELGYPQAAVEDLAKDGAFAE